MLEGFEPVVVDTLGGLCTLIERSDLPPGLSPAAENVTFFPGGVKSRGGFDILFSNDDSPAAGYWGGFAYVNSRGYREYVTFSGGTGSIVSLNTGASPAIAGHPSMTHMELMGNGGTYSTIRAAAAYGKAYVCVSDGKRGITVPLQIDGSGQPYNVSASGGHEAYITFSAGTTGIVAGRYFIVTAFETVTGFITGVSKINYESANLGDTLSLTSIPIGPVGTVKRRIFISLPDSFELYNPGDFVINDNTTTSLSGLGPSPGEIAEGLPFINFLNLRPPSAHLGVEFYSNRLVFWGGDGKIESFVGPTTVSTNPNYSSLGLINLDFSSEVASAYTWATPGEYVEWYGADGAATVVAGSKAQGEMSNYVRFTSAGGATDGLIQQGYGSSGHTTLRPNRDVLGAMYLYPTRTYGIRVRARKTSSALVGNLVLKLYEVTNITTRSLLTTLTVPVADLGTEWGIFEVSGTTAATDKPYVGIDVYIDSVSSGAVIDAGHIEIFDTEFRRNTSIVSISRVDDPESLDSVLGRISVNSSDGQEIRNVFVLHGNLYICKENSLYVTQDNGQEPVTWQVENVSATVGTPSVHGVGMGDSFALIASRDGLYLMTGGMPEKISQEIQPTWDNFDWSKGEQIYCAVDTAHRFAVVGGPALVGGHQQLRIDFVGGWSDPMGGGDAVRKWSKDIRTVGSTNYGFTGALQVEMANGEKRMAYTSASPHSIFFTEDDTLRNDDEKLTSGTAQKIVSTYETAPIGTEIARSLFGGVMLKVRGVGTLISKYVRPNASTISLASKTLTAAPIHDVEIRTHSSDTQLGYRLGVSETNGYFVAKRIAILRKKHPGAQLRGY